MSIHVEATVTTADGSTPSGDLYVQNTNGPMVPVTGETTVFDQRVETSGAQEFMITFYPDDHAGYATSSDTTTVTAFRAS